MEPSIPDGSFCLFQLPTGGTRNGKKLVVQHRDIHDAETGGHYTLKLYRSEKLLGTDGTWSHSRITLSPENPAYQQIVFEESDEGEILVVAEFLEVLPPFQATDQK